MTILEDLYNALLTQEEKEAQYIATALEIYVTGSLNVFNHRTSINIENRIVSFDIKELGKQLKKIGMLIVQDQSLGPMPNKNRNFDTKRIGVTVLTFFGKNGVFAALLPPAASKENPARFVFLVGFLPLWASCGPRNR